MTEASEYGLRHLPSHLADAGRVAQLFELARDPTFSGRQSTRFASEPKVSLSAQRSALMTAASRNEAIAVAEFALRHLVGLFALSHESPLTAERSGALSRAWQLADYPDADDRSLWYLLLAWDLAARGLSQASEATLIRLLELEPTEISPGRYLNQENWKNEYARLFLENLADPPSRALEKLASRLLPEHQRTAVLTHVGDWQLRDETVDRNPMPYEADDAAIAVDALRQALEGDIAAARQTLHGIRLDGYGFRTRAYISVIGSLRAEGEVATAIALAAEALRPIDEYQQLTVSHVQALAGLAVGAPQLDRQRRAALLDEGVHAASTIEDAQQRFDACHEIACAALTLVGVDDYHQRITEVMGADDEPAQAEIGVSACRVLAEADRLDEALELAAGLPEPFWWTSFPNAAYAAVSRVLSAKGDLWRAEEVAGRVKLHTWEATAEGVSLAARADALAGLVVGAVRAQETRLAENAYEQIISKGSGTEGDLEKWNAARHEAYAALLLHFLDAGRGDKVRELIPAPAIPAADIECLARAADSIANREWDGAVAHVTAVGDPTWAGRALCRMAQLASRANVLRLAALALDRARVEEHHGSRLHLLGEISDLVAPLGDEATASQVTALLNQTGVGPTGDIQTSLGWALDIALRDWRLDQLHGLLSEAGEWPTAAYRLCVVIAKRYAGTAERIMELVRTIDGPRYDRSDRRTAPGPT